MKRVRWYLVFLIAAFLTVWVWAAIHPLYPDDWILENRLVVIFVPLILIAGFYFRLSNLSYTLITAFMVLHVIGAHYTYSEVPFGYTLQSWFGTSRNMYDRLVHFSFGLLLAYPIREVFVRITKAKGLWGYYLPIELTLAFSAIYEIIEWLTAATVDPSAGLAFLGAQGDVWDAQKDMLMAGIGSIIAMGVTVFINIVWNRDFWKELRESLKIPQDNSILGEVKLAKMMGKKSSFNVVTTI